MMQVLKNISDVLNRIIEAAAMVIVSIITLLTFSGVIARFIFNEPVVWIYELTLVLFSWTIFLGVSSAFKRSEHIRLDLIYHYLPSRAAWALSLLVDAAVFIFLIIVVRDGIEVVLSTIDQNYNTINLSTAWFYAPFPAAAAVSLFHIITGKFGSGGPGITARQEGGRK